MHMIRRSYQPTRVHCAAIPLLLLVAGSGLCADVTIEQGEYEGRPQFVIRTARSTYFYDRAGGGFSRLIDVDGRDWVAFRKDPLSNFPQSAAAGYRGIANLVFGAGNPDAGAGHPGFDQCVSTIVGEHTISTRSKSGTWHWRWSFTEDHATLTILQADPVNPYWFLYEGPVGGKWSPSTHYFGTDAGGPLRDLPDTKNQSFGRWRWAYFGDKECSRVLLAVQRRKDQLDDTLWYLGDSAQGISSNDGMIVFGFGRGPGTQPLFREAGEQFRIGFVESPLELEPAARHAAITEVAGGWLDRARWPDKATGSPAHR